MATRIFDKLLMYAAVKTLEVSVWHKVAAVQSVLPRYLERVVVVLVVCRVSWLQSSCLPVCESTGAGAAVVVQGGT